MGEGIQMPSVVYSSLRGRLISWHVSLEMCVTVCPRDPRKPTEAILLGSPYKMRKPTDSIYRYLKSHNVFAIFNKNAPAQKDVLRMGWSRKRNCGSDTRKQVKQRAVEGCTDRTRSDRECVFSLAVQVCF